jgi:hypothetical protein
VFAKLSRASPTAQGYNFDVMKIFALAVLLAVMQAGPQSPRQTTNNPAQTTGQVKNKGASSQAEPLPGPSLTKANSSGPAKSDSNEQHPEDAQHTVGISKLPPVTINAPKRDWADWAYWGFNLLLVTVGGFQVYLLYRTLEAISAQASEMRRQVDVTLGQLRAMHEQIAEMSVQSAHAGISADAAKKSADAAKTTADALLMS